MIWLIVFNVLMVVLIAAALSGNIPKRLYQTFLRGLHFTIGITTPTDRQLRWTLAVWLISTLAIVDGMVLVFAYL